MTYAVPGDPALGQRVLGLLNGAGFAAGSDPDRGLDHGVWVPLMLLYPEADIPVVTVSVQPLADPTHHFRLGRALAPLTEEDVLVLGSGGATHNLRDVLGRPLDWPTPDHARAFDAWLVEAVTDGRVADLLAYRERAPEAVRNHPTPEHLLPFFVALGAGGEAPRGRALHRSFEYGALAMTCFGWD
jgi:4,5-DOPA dioxygenase extradiol